MTQSLEAVTAATLARMLDAASLRHQVFAANIANAHVPGYVQRTPAFASQFDALESAWQEESGSGAAQLAPLSARLDMVLDAQGQPAPVQLDEQAIAMAHNALHYQTLVTGLNRHYGLLSQAVSDGKK